MSASPGRGPDDANLQTGSLVLGAGSALVTAGAAIMVNAAIPGIALIAIGLLLIGFSVAPHLRRSLPRGRRATAAAPGPDQSDPQPGAATPAAANQARRLLPLTLSSLLGVVAGAVAILILLPRFMPVPGQTHTTQAGPVEGCAAGSQLATEAVNAPQAPGPITATTLFRIDPARTGVQPGPAPVGEPTLLRHFAVTGDITASPAIADGVAYIGTWDGKVYAWAVSAEEDRPRWVFHTQGPIASSAAVADGTVYVGSSDGCLYAIDALTGDERWRFASGISISSSPAVVEGVVYFGNGQSNSTDSTLYALDARSGAERWSFDVRGPIYSSPAVVDGLVYFGVWNLHMTNFYALDADDGEERWSFTAAGQIFASPVVVADTVYVADYHSHLYALYASNGVTRWTFSPFGDDVFEYDKLINASPAVADGTIYMIGWSNYLFAVDTATGKERWRADISDDPNSKPGDEQGPRSSPAYADGVIFAGSDDGNIYAVDAASGEKLWHYATTGPVASSPVVWNGAVYIGVDNDEGSLIALGGGGTPVAQGQST